MKSKPHVYHKKVKSGDGERCYMYEQTTIRKYIGPCPIHNPMKKGKEPMPEVA